MKFIRKRNKKAGKQWLTQAFALILAVSLCMSGLVGCGKKKESDKLQDNQQTEQEKENKPGNESDGGTNKRTYQVCRGSRRRGNGEIWTDAGVWGLSGYALAGRAFVSRRLVKGSK